MRKGDLPTLAGGYSYVSAWSDGAKASHLTMRGLRKDGLIDYPHGTSIQATWTLTEKGRRQ